MKEKCDPDPGGAVTVQQIKENNRTMKHLGKKLSGEGCDLTPVGWGKGGGCHGPTNGRKENNEKLFKMAWG